ncbi:restriction endonuclease [Massilia endophytica]|uniref:restriction endonuclease n=1 Tax=Massilia endophytica TaxID=2899220 RepID=UPI001E2D4B02|nr:restriction endonuclease [Massilia endophytica]UGQ48777.1 restriction endonuclease [Massilia endophytica]
MIQTSRGPLAVILMQSLTAGSLSERFVFTYARRCGWWIAEDRAVLPATRWQYWAVTLASMSALEEFSLSDIDLPLQEVRRYLMRKFERRAAMHPRLFELIVADVFRDLDYRSAATAYSNDGGIDVILEAGHGQRIGVQVKRQKRTIEVEQIRAFLGALTLGGFARGVFVSSSRFSRGAVRAAEQSTSRIMPIQLIDANRFFDVLGYAQLQHAPTPDNCGISQSVPLIFQPHSHYHLNTL